LFFFVHYAVLSLNFCWIRIKVNESYSFSEIFKKVLKNLTKEIFTEIYFVYNKNVTKSNFDRILKAFTFQQLNSLLDKTTQNPQKVGIIF
jgi:predicted thioredoxin/glutaredoxin